MKMKEIRSMTPEEANAKLMELRKEQIKLYTQISSGTNLKNPSLVKKTRRTIAKILHHQHILSNQKKKEE